LHHHYIVKAATMRRRV